MFRFAAQVALVLLVVSGTSDSQLTYDDNVIDDLGVDALGNPDTDGEQSNPYISHTQSLIHQGFATLGYMGFGCCDRPGRESQKPEESEGVGAGHSESDVWRQ